MGNPLKRMRQALFGGDSSSAATGYTRDQAALAQEAAKLDRDKWATWKSQFLPVIAQLRRQANELGSEAGQRRYADTYSGTFQQQANKQGQMANRALSRYGARPGSGKWQGTQRALQVANAAGGAHAANTGREVAREGARTINMGLVNPGMSLSGQSGQSLATAIQGLGSAGDREAGREQGALDRIFSLIADGGLVEIPDERPGYAFGLGGFSNFRNFKPPAAAPMNTGAPAAQPAMEAQPIYTGGPVTLPGMNLPAQTSGSVMGSMGRFGGRIPTRIRGGGMGSMFGSWGGGMHGFLADGGHVEIPDGEGGRIPVPFDDEQPPDGGEIRGPGTGTSDSIKARISNGEYYFPEYAVRHYGTDKLDKMIQKAREAQASPEGPRAKILQGDPDQAAPPMEGGRPGFAGGLWGWVAEKALEKGIEKGIGKANEGGGKDHSEFNTTDKIDTDWDYRPGFAEGYPPFQLRRGNLLEHFGAEEYSPRGKISSAMGIRRGSLPAYSGDAAKPSQTQGPARPTAHFSGPNDPRVTRAALKFQPGPFGGLRTQGVRAPGSMTGQEPGPAVVDTGRLQSLYEVPKVAAAAPQPDPTAADQARWQQFSEMMGI